MAGIDPHVIWTRQPKQLIAKIIGVVSSYLSVFSIFRWIS
jgi:hypothetical protein